MISSQKTTRIPPEIRQLSLTLFSGDMRPPKIHQLNQYIALLAWYLLIIILVLTIENKLQKYKKQYLTTSQKGGYSMKRLFICLVGFFLLLGAANLSSAAVLWDWSPELYGNNLDTKNWSNRSSDQNFGERISFASDVEVTGMDIWSGSRWGSTGESATIRFWTDSGGDPGVLFSDFTENISVDTLNVGAVIDITRKHVDFSAAVSLSADTYYWVGMSGTSSDFAQMVFSTTPPGNSRMAQFSGTTFLLMTNVGDMAFRLYGEATAVPEPSTLLLLGSGLVGLGFVRRRFKR